MMTTQIVFLLAGLLSGFGVGYIFGWRRGATEQSAEQSAESQKLIVTLSEKVTEQALTISTLAEAAKREHDQKVRVVEMVAVAERNASEMREKYYATTLGHSAAQAMMMREIERLLGLLHKHGVKNVAISSTLSAVAADFQKNFSDPMKAEKNQLSRPLAPEPSAVANADPPV